MPGLPTNNKAELYPVLWVLTHSDPRICLTIYTDSQYVIHCTCHWAASNASHGWKCINGDILQDLSRVLSSWWAVTNFIWVKGHNNNFQNNAADSNAKEGALSEPYIQSYSCPAYRTTAPPLHLTPLSICKVTTSLPRIPVPTQSKIVHLSNIEPNDSNAHRGRVKVCMLQNNNLKMLLECKNDRRFWKYIRHWLDSKKRPAHVNLNQLKVTFKKRMNPLTILSPSFDSTQWECNRSLADLIPLITIDSTSGHYFSRPFSMADIEWAKLQMKKHPSNSA